MPYAQLPEISSDDIALSDIGKSINEYITTITNIKDLSKKVCDPSLNPYERKDLYSQLQDAYSKIQDYGIKKDNTIIEKMQNQVNTLLSDIDVYVPIPVGENDKDTITDTQAYGDDVSKKSYSITDKDGKKHTVLLVKLKTSDGKQVTALDLLKNWNNNDISYTAKWETPNLTEKYGKDLGWNAPIYSGCSDDMSAVDKMQISGTPDSADNNGININADHHLRDCSSSAHYECTATASSQAAAEYCISQKTDDYQKDGQILDDLENQAYS